MKKILLVGLLLGMIIFISCEDKTSPVLEIKNPAQLQALAQTEYAFSAANASEQLTINWQPVDYGFQALVEYSVYLTNKSNDKSIKIGQTSDNRLVLNYAEMNNYLGKINLYPGVAQDVQISLRTSAYSDKDIADGGNTIEFKATVYDPNAVTWSFVYVATGYPDWTWIDSYMLGSINGDGIYEGYSYFADGNSTYRIVDAVTLEPLSEIQTVESAGFYKITFDAAGTVSQSDEPIVWGLIGDATPGDWTNDTEMEYDPETRLLVKATRLLAGKEFKFRGNNEWVFDYGAVSGQELNMGGELIAGGENIKAVADIDTLYRIELNLTEAGKYSYTIAETSFVPSSEFITMPGNYQGWDPDAESAYRLTSPARDYIFTGYHYIPDNTEFKFYDKGNWMGIDGSINWNDDRTGGSFELGGDDIIIEKGEYYYFSVNTEKKTCTFRTIGWGIVGDGSPSGEWDKDAMLTYNPTDGTWYGTFDFIGGEIKFRWDRDWAINLGGTDFDNLEYDDPSNLTIGTGNFTIVLDPVAKRATVTAN